MDRPRRDRAWLVSVASVASLAGLAVAAFALRIAFRIDYDEDIDALRFALGVERFDPAELRPHAPFYPVYIAAAKVVALATSARGALGIVGAIAGAALVVMTALLAHEVVGRRAAYVAGALALASPFLWVASEKLTSDVPGAAITTAGLWLCAKAGRLAAARATSATSATSAMSATSATSATNASDEPRAEATGATRASDEARARAIRTTALVLLGVGLGVRLSYFPIAIACALVIGVREGGGRALAARAGDVGVGVLLWLIPLVATTPPRALVATTWVQGMGHFTRWGGTAITVSSPLERASGWLWGLWANALGGAWPDAPWPRWIAAPIVIGLVAWLVVRASTGGGLRAFARAQPELVIATAAYFVWAALGQNTAYKPRHWMPLVPALIVGLAAAIDALLERAPRWRPAIIAPIVLGAQWIADGATLARAHISPSPVAALVAFLDRSADRDTRRVITFDLAQMIVVGAPRRAALRITSDEALIAAVTSAGERGALITTEALSEAAWATLKARGYTLRTAFAAPRSRYVDPLWNELSLIEATPPAAGAEDAGGAPSEHENER